LSYGIDTTYYSNGNIKSISKRYSYYKEYYENGNKKHIRKSDQLFARGKEKYYDENKQLVSKGKLIFDFRKHGLWKEFKNSKLISRKRYKFGREKSSLITSEGKSINVYFRMAKVQGGRLCEEAENKYKFSYYHLSTHNLNILLIAVL
jgi:hypothetical protein